MNERTLRCGVVGLGRMGSHHVRLYTETEGAQLVGGVDPDPDRRRIAEEKWGMATFETVGQLLESKVDAVSVATPTMTHLEVGRSLLEANVACLIEKPLAPNEMEAQALADIGERSGAVLQVGHVVRYDPVTTAIKEIPNLRPRFIEVDRISPMTFRSIDVGVVLDMMIHDIDVLLMLLGAEPVEVYANAVAVIGESEDVCNARLVFPPGDDGIACVANVTASRLAFKTERKIRLISEDTYVSADFVKRSGTVVHKKGNAEELSDIKSRVGAGEDLTSLNFLEIVNVEPLRIKEQDALKAEISDFLEAVRDGRRPSVDVHAGFAAVRTAQRISEVARAAAMPH